MEEARAAPVLDVPPWLGEDREANWGFLDVEGKVVLDVGADYGSTAAYFLNKGAAKVICIESYDNDYGALEVLAKGEPRMEAHHTHISSPLELETLIITYQPEVVKIDIEGGEVHLLDVRSCVLWRVGQYGIEVHNLANSIRSGNPRPPAYEGVNDLMPLFEALFETLGNYTVEKLYQGKWVLHARRNS